MAYMRRLHPKGVPFLGFKRMCSRGDLTRQTRVGCVWTEMCVLQTNAGKLVLRCTVNFGGQITGLHDTAPPNLAFEVK